MGYFGYKGMNSFLWIALIEVALVAFIVAAVSSVAVSLAMKVRPRPVATTLDTLLGTAGAISSVAALSALDISFGWIVGIAAAITIPAWRGVSRMRVFAGA